ncbi:hypothetical protein N7533_007336 [Penicillium manginii]|uniref:uncharacterized protein n=1 Tax=Penicillium manginii TaxID=203109 RepID=UPI0025468063|nr:uncharacterized protein N7533_007336 [Penicillium manginii]KAJ5750308.1 hypothetical protein N7533_007336 [Penicillium manginii]
MSSFNEPKLNDLIPTLTGAETSSPGTTLFAGLSTYAISNFTSFLLPVPTIIPAAPATATTPAIQAATTGPDPAELEEWETKSRFIIPWINAKIFDNLKCYIDTAENAFVAYNNLRQASTSLILTGFVRYVKCTSLFYHGTKQDPQDFINRWRAALEEASRFCGPFPSRHIYYQLLIAIGYTKDIRQWLELLEQDPLATCESILKQTYADFVTSEHSRLPPWQYQSVHMSALDTNSASSPSKHGRVSQYCEFHKSRALHSTDDCYLNPTTCNNLHNDGMEWGGPLLLHLHFFCIRHQRYGQIALSHVGS